MTRINLFPNFKKKTYKKKINMLFTELGRSVWEKTVPEVLSTARGMFGEILCHFLFLFFVCLFVRCFICLCACFCGTTSKERMKRVLYKPNTTCSGGIFAIIVSITKCPRRSSRSIFLTSTVCALTMTALTILSAGDIFL